MHEVVSFLRCLLADYCCNKMRNGVIRLHGNLTCDKIFYKSLIECLDILFNIVKTNYMTVALWVSAKVIRNQMNTRIGHFEILYSERNADDGYAKCQTHDGIIQTDKKTTKNYSKEIS